MRTYYVVHRGIGHPSVAIFPCDTDRDDGAWEAACKVQDELNRAYHEGYRDGQSVVTGPDAPAWQNSTPLRYVVTYIDDGWTYPTQED